MVLADAAAALSIPTWIGVAAVGTLASMLAWAGNRAVKAIDDKLIEHNTRLQDAVLARHDLANKNQKQFDALSEMLHEQDKSLALIRQKLGIRE